MHCSKTHIDVMEYMKHINIVTKNLTELTTLPEASILECINRIKNPSAAGIALVNPFDCIFAVFRSKARLERFRKVTNKPGAQYEDLIRGMFDLSADQNDIVFGTPGSDKKEARSAEQVFASVFNRHAKLRGLNYRYSAADQPALADYVLAVHRAFESALAIDSIAPPEAEVASAAAA